MPKQSPFIQYTFTEWQSCAGETGDVSTLMGLTLLRGGWRVGSINTLTKKWTRCFGMMENVWQKWNWLDGGGRPFWDVKGAETWLTRRGQPCQGLGQGVSRPEGLKHRDLGRSGKREVRVIIRAVMSAPQALQRPSCLSKWAGKLSENFKQGKVPLWLEDARMACGWGKYLLETRRGQISSTKSFKEHLKHFLQNTN